MITATTPLNTKFGRFTINYHQWNNEHCVSIVMGDVTKSSPLIRMHSSCLFGEAFGACDCDCRQQLEGAMECIAKEGAGVIVYLFQEGRGVGLENKIKAIGVQHSAHVDTVEAFISLGFELDQRDYSVAAEALKDLEVPLQIRLICNNPRKANALRSAGFDVKIQNPLKYAVTAEAADYLHVKQRKLGHMINFSNITEEVV